MLSKGSAEVRTGQPRRARGAIRATVGARTRDAIFEGWIIGLLSGPKTHLVNSMSNTSVLILQIGERAVASRLGRVLGNDGSVQVGESMAMTFGMLQGLKDALRFAGRSFRTGQTGFGVGKIDLRGRVPYRPKVSTSSATLGSAGRWTISAPAFVSPDGLSAPKTNF